MPLYEYKCTQCKRHTEKIQKFSDPEITTCPHCGGPLERVISAPAIAFKGGGWFKDGYGNAAPAGSKSDSKNDSAGSGGSSSDTTAAPSSTTPAPAVATTPAAPSSTSTSSASIDKK